MAFDDLAESALGTLPTLLQQQASHRGAQIALRYKRLGLWHETGWREIADVVARLARALAVQGFVAGDALILLSHPRPEAVLLALAAQTLGGVAVPFDPDRAPQELSTLLQQVHSDFVFAEGQVQLDRVFTAGLLPSMIVYADGRGLRARLSDRLTSYEELLAAVPTAGKPVLSASTSAEPAFVLYQLDQSGAPRRQVLTHAALLAQAVSVVEREQLTDQEQALAARAFAAAGQARYLLAPWLVAGFCLNFPENLATRDNDRRELGPTLVAGTSASYQRLEQMVRARLPAAGSWRGNLFERALTNRLGFVNRALAKWLVLRPLRDVIGLSRTRVPLLMGEGLPEPSARFFAALGIAIRRWPDAADWHVAEPARQTELIRWKLKVKETS
jgi:long-subunit acyl-CoA synthetase (AMP-forming)